MPKVSPFRSLRAVSNNDNFVYDIDMFPLLRFQEIAPDKPFHAATFQLQQSAQAPQPHRHDFWEMAYNLNDEGVNVVNDIEYSISKGSLLLIRPNDQHRVISRGCWQFVNIAFPAHTFGKWCKIAGLKTEFSSWENAPNPQITTLSGGAQKSCEAAFRRMAALYGRARSSEIVTQSTPRLELELCRFWNEVAPLFAEQDALHSAPPWFSIAMTAMQSEENLRLGYPKMLEMCHVASAHLSRVCRLATGLSPTQWVNEARLQQAASLLISTTRSIDDISESCGFANRAYFYRLFARRFNTTPRLFALQAQRIIAP